MLTEHKFSNLVSIGIDVVEISRFSEIQKRTPNFFKRVFSDDELSGDEAVETIAGKFAAKEAVFKCLKQPLFALPFLDVQILNESSGAPLVELSGEAREIAEELSIAKILISISHTDSVSTAISCGVLK
jgi:holo-[acyl-carrier protein] synthase